MDNMSLDHHIPISCQEHICFAHTEGTPHWEIGTNFSACGLQNWHPIVVRNNSNTRLVLRTARKWVPLAWRMTSASCLAYRIQLATVPHEQQCFGKGFYWLFQWIISQTYQWRPLFPWQSSLSPIGPSQFHISICKMYLMQSCSRNEYS